MESLKYLIPKEIKSKPRLFGLGLKECIILLVGCFSILTFLKDLVHSSLVVPFIIVSVLFLLWMVMPSANNRGKQNYETIYLLIKKNRIPYHAIDTNKAINQMLRNEG